MTKRKPETDPYGDSVPDFLNSDPSTLAPPETEIEKEYQWRGEWTPVLSLVGLVLANIASANAEVRSAAPK
jgi:hypothetical protein